MDGYMLGMDKQERGRDRQRKTIDRNTRRIRVEGEFVTPREIAERLQKRPAWIRTRLHDLLMRRQPIMWADFT